MLYAAMSFSLPSTDKGKVGAKNNISASCYPESYGGALCSYSLLSLLQRALVLLHNACSLALPTRG